MANLMYPVLSVADAHRLNQAAQKLDSRLFLCCNYQPTCDINNAGGTLEIVTDNCSWYLTAIQDLYKFCIDSSCIIKNPRKILVSSVQNLAGLNNILKSLKPAVGTVQMLRSVKSHNQSPGNGQHCVEYLFQYQNWVRRVLQNSSTVPQTERDFELLNDELYNIADTVRTGLEQFLNLLNSQSPTTKKEIVEKWIEATFDWYANGVKRDIYRGQLEADYLSRAGFYIPANQLRRKVNDWIYKARIQNGQSSGGPLREELSGFFQNLPSQFRTTRQSLDHNLRLRYTLLPDDFMPHDINLYFDSVPSPDGDF